MIESKCEQLSPLQWTCVGYQQHSRLTIVRA